MSHFVRNGIQRAARAFGFQLQRLHPRFEPYVEHVALAGVSFDFWIADATGKEWYDPRDHQQFAEHAETARLIKPGDRVLEIGTHHGFYGMVIARLVGDTGFLLGIEPSPFNAMMAMAQVALNRAANFTVLNAAAGERSGTLRISRDSNAMVTASRDGIEVPSVTVDDLDASHGPFNALKIDTEGFEYEVLSGAPKLLARHPKLLLELHPSAHPVESVLTLLGTSYGGTFVPRSARDRIQHFPTERIPENEIVNLFLTPPNS